MNVVGSQELFRGGVGSFGAGFVAPPMAHPQASWEDHVSRLAALDRALQWLAKDGDAELDFVVTTAEAFFAFLKGVKRP